MSSPSKTEITNTSVNSGALDTNEEQTNKNICSSSGKGRVIQKNYVLNDTAALKKKLRHETRKDPFNLGTEARNGSNMVIELKTSFFEHVKAEFIKDLMTKENIKQVENALGAKASTENSGEAYVEYSLDIVFQVNDKTYSVKLTAYTTSCRVMFQPVGDPPQTRIQPSNKSIPRFFADTYFLPWCEAAYSSKTYDEKALMDAIRHEIKRLDLTKVVTRKGNVTRGRLASLPSPETKCVARGCKYTGLNTNNKNAVGVCAKCGGVEHFECSKTKHEEREDILRGVMKYFCSVCFSNNPSMIAFSPGEITEEPRVTSPHPVIQITSRTKAVHIQADPVPHPIEPEIKYKCSKCTHEAETQASLVEHQNEHHDNEKESSKNCNYEATESSELEEHAEKVTFICTFCEKGFTTKSDLESHMEDHSTLCPLCNLTFTDNIIFAEHLKNNHSPTCPLCKEQFSNKSELETHIEESHSPSSITCNICNKTFHTNEALDVHTAEKHINNCQICQETFSEEAELSKHMETKHTLKCTLCDYTTETQTSLEEHVVQTHYIQCPMCPIKLKDINTFSSHFKKEHNHPCEICEKDFGTSEELVKHIERNHTVDVFKCEMCDFESGTKTNIRNHILEVHYTPDVNGNFTCDECRYQCNSREQLRKHFDEEHIDKEGNREEVTENPSEVNPNEELRLLRINFKRLEGLFHDSIEEMNSVKSEYEAKLIEANDKYRAAKAENEELKERVDILFKLGRSYINRTDNNKKNEEHLPAHGEGIDVIEAVTIDDSEDEKDKDETVNDLLAWSQSKMRGFKRVGPSVSASVISNTKKPSSNPSKSPSKRSPQRPRAPSPSPDTPSSDPSASTNLKENEDKRGEKKSLYCHYFSNYGKCLFEERTGGTCKFLHRDAPLCRSGRACQRSKCMFKHPNLEGMHRNQTFLEQSQFPQRTFPSPWQFQMLNPWLPQTQFHQNPWNIEMRRN